MRAQLRIVLFFWFIVSFSTSQVVAKSKSNVVDLGNIEIEGEVRRPPIKVFNSSVQLRKVLVKLSSYEFADFEKEMLRPSGVVKAGANQRKEEQVGN